MIPFCCASTARSLTQTRTHTQSSPYILYSSILAKISEFLKRKYSYKKKLINISNPDENKKGKPTHILSNFNRITFPTRQQNPIARLDKRRHNIPLYLVRQVRRRSQSLRGADSTWQKSGGIFPMPFSESSSFVRN